MKIKWLSMLKNVINHYNPPEYLYARGQLVATDLSSLISCGEEIVYVYKLEKKILIGKEPNKIWQKDLL